MMFSTEALAIQVFAYVQAQTQCALGLSSHAPTSWPVHTNSQYRTGLSIAVTEHLTLGRKGSENGTKPTQDLGP